MLRMPSVTAKRHPGGAGSYAGGACMEDQMLIKIDNVHAAQYHKLLGALLSDANIFRGRDGPRPIVQIKSAETGKVQPPLPGGLPDHHVTLEVSIRYYPEGSEPFMVPLSVLANIFDAMGIFPSVPNNDEGGS
jgi:hypothetical protein